jgi:hypothetical protein
VTDSVQSGNVLARLLALYLVPALAYADDVSLQRRLVDFGDTALSGTAGYLQSAAVPVKVFPGGDAALVWVGGGGAIAVTYIVLVVRTI